MRYFRLNQKNLQFIYEIRQIESRTPQVMTPKNMWSTTKVKEVNSALLENSTAFQNMASFTEKCRKRISLSRTNFTFMFFWLELKQTGLFRKRLIGEIKWGETYEYSEWVTKLITSEWEKDMSREYCPHSLSFSFHVCTFLRRKWYG